MCQLIETFRIFDCYWKMWFLAPRSQNDDFWIWGPRLPWALKFHLEVKIQGIFGYQTNICDGVFWFRPYFNFQFFNPFNLDTSFGRVKMTPKMPIFPLFEVHRHKKYWNLWFWSLNILNMTKKRTFCCVRTAKTKAIKPGIFSLLTVFR